MSTVIHILDRRMAQVERTAREWAERVIAEVGIDEPEAYTAEVIAMFLDAEREQYSGAPREEVTCRSVTM